MSLSPLAILHTLFVWWVLHEKKKKIFKIRSKNNKHASLFGLIKVILCIHHNPSKVMTAIASFRDGLIISIKLKKMLYCSLGNINSRFHLDNFKTMVFLDWQFASSRGGPGVVYLWVAAGVQRSIFGKVRSNCNTQLFYFLWLWIWPIYATPVVARPLTSI